ncbi:hypothetical protein WICMUC_000189 [Wickerhamomyces mucosus]|uniref:Scaffold protein Nfu/NifU N-terminal domain-containing protein n=1 Tax=Wickerhamomyces mucosus TaxID=1378264 RepID=A0A9P8TIF0_9ASCO|nr:hypothetical protein WICMUC_000189 [Wickerhamomyces mucosus]
MFKSIPTRRLLQIPSFTTTRLPSQLFIKRSLFIQTEETPNEHAVKFKSSRKLLPTNQTLEILSKRESINQPLACKIFEIDGIKSILIGSDFITIEKTQNEQWGVLKPELFMILTEFLSSKEEIIIPEKKTEENELLGEDEDELISMIKELIETRIKPTIQEDGGDLEFIKFNFETGTVYLKLKGACRSCESSSITLKNGIESMLKHYIEEIEAVEQIDEEDEFSIPHKDEIQTSNSGWNVPPPNI